MKKDMKVRVYHDRDGQIVSIIEIKDEKDIPPASISSIPDTEFFEIKLTEELSKIPLIDLHTKYMIDLMEKKPHLVKHKIINIQ